jgi:hypothetical protein
MTVQQALARFDAPGLLRDLDDAGLQAWSDFISEQFDEARERQDPRLTNYGPRHQFFNPLKQPVDNDAAEKDITWTAFPRIVKIGSTSDRQRWRTADSSRDTQDEYCEWSLTRDPQTDKIVRITFTSEGPEYWYFLASSNPQKVVELYKQHISPNVQSSDLFIQGKYNPRNKWNNSTANGAMHLIQRNNTLTAEIELAAGASIVRRKNGQLVTDQQELIECGAYGAPERNSDPHIGALVNELARQKADVSLANPVGLCIAGLSVAGWQTPDGSNPLDYWTITRGTSDKALRAVYEVPAGKNFVVGDIKIGGRNVEFGAQIADFVTIKLTGLATRFGKSTVAPMDGCVQQVTPAALQAEAPSGRQALQERAFSHTRA